MNLIRSNIVRTTLFVICLGTITLFLYKPIFQAVQYNPWLNAFILTILFYGMASIFQQFKRLLDEQKWLENFENSPNHEITTLPIPHVLAPLHMMSIKKGESFQLPSNPMAVQTLLTSIGSRLSSIRKGNRYLMSIVVFLGLLGTFWGLAKTIGSIIDMLSNLETIGSDFSIMMQKLKEGIQNPLGGMGVAFSSSLFGISASLIIGFMDQQVGGACLKFYDYLEEKLTINMIGEGNSLQQFSTSAHISTTPQTYNISKTAEVNDEGTLNNIILSQGAPEIVTALYTLTERLNLLTDQIVVNQKFVKKVGDNQNKMNEIFDLVAMSTKMNQNLYELLEFHLRKLEGNTDKMLSELEKGKGGELQKDMQTLAKILTVLIRNKDNQAA